MTKRKFSNAQSSTKRVFVRKNHAKQKVKDTASNNMSEIFFESAPYVLNIWDETPKIIATSKQSSKLFGLSSQEEYIERFHELSPEFQPCGTPSSQKAIQCVQEAFEKGHSEFEWLHITADGEPLPMDINLVRFTHKGKRMLASYAADMRKAAAAMKGERDAAALIRAVFDSSPHVINIWDHNAKLVSTSQEGVILHGLKDQEEYLAKFQDLHPKYQPCGSLSQDLVREYLDKTYKEGFARFEWMHIKGDGTPIPTEVVLVRFYRDDKPWIIAYTVDLTQVKLAAEHALKLELELRENVLSTRIRRIYDSSPVGIVTYRADKTLVECNNVCAEIFGFSNKEEMIKNFSSSFPPMSPMHQPNMELSKTRALKLYEDTITEGRVQFEWMHVTASGDPLPSDITFVRMDYDDTFEFVTYIRDLREVKAAQQRENEALFIQRQLYDSSPIASSLWDINRRAIGCNDAMVRLLGLESKDQFVKEFWKFSPEYQSCGRTSLEKFEWSASHIIEKGFVAYDWDFIDTRGQVIPGSVVAVRLDLPDGGMQAAVYFQDLRAIRSAMAAENAAQASKMEALVSQQEMYDSNPVASSLWSINSEPLDCNEAMVKLLELESKDQYMNDFLSLCPEYQPCGTKTIDILPEIAAHTLEHGFCQYDWTFITTKGELVPGNAVMTLISLPDGKKQVAAYFQDLRLINAAMASERAAQEALKYREKLLNAVNDAAEILLQAEDDDILVAITEGMEIVGTCLNVDRAQIWRNEEIDGELHFVMRYEWLSELGKMRKQVPLGFSYPYSSMPDWYERFLQGKSVNNHVFNLTPEESAFWGRYETVSIVCLPLFVNQELIGFFSMDDCEQERIFSPDEMDMIASAGFMFTSAFNRNIQASQIAENNKKLEEARKLSIQAQIAEESNRAKSQFLARMSHEIRTPITAVMGISEIQLQNLDMSPVVEEAFAKIFNSSNHLLGIINDILDLSKIEAGKMEIIAEKYDIASVISDAAHLHLSHIGSKKIEFRMYLDENLPAYLLGDAIRIGQILNNIMSNAFKYTETGTVSLSFTSEENTDGMITLAISISDTGMGMTREQLDALYSDYTRFHEAGNRQISGTGLGMPIVYSLVQMMDGFIEIDSAVGQGTTVSIHIPQKISGNQLLGTDAVHKLLHFQLGTGAARKRFDFTPEPMPYGKVLVVDDIEANLYVAQGLLAFYGLTIETCESGQDAINKVRNGKVYDIVFMDQMMPGLTGTQTMNIMREMGYTQPIVALTANALIGQAEALLQDGFDGFVSKPIQTKHLNSILIKHIRDKQPPEVIEEVRKTHGNVKPSGSINNFQYDKKLVKKLREDFIKSHSSMHSDIVQAVMINDHPTVQLLAHTLKGLAGLIHEKALAHAAEIVERCTRTGDMPQAGQLEVLCEEMQLVLDSIAAEMSGDIGAAQPASTSHTAAADVDIIEILDKLEPLLKSTNTECFEYIDHLRNIPECAIIVCQMEEFKFAQAASNIAAVRKILG